MTRPQLIYTLFSGNLYGTERMALATLEGFRDTHDLHLVTPHGLVVEEAESKGIIVHPLDGVTNLWGHLGRISRKDGEMSLFTTSIKQALVVESWRRTHRAGKKLQHIHAVHGGAADEDSFGRKWLLNYLGTPMVAVSDFVKARLVHHRVREDRVHVIENFICRDDLPTAQGIECSDSVRSVALVSRLDPIKRVDLLLDALDRHPELRDLEFHVFGSGSVHHDLEARARRDHPNVVFKGYVRNVAEEIQKADLFLHLCDQEPFGLAILEAMTAGVPVLVPGAGGAGRIIRDGVTGLQFLPGDAGHLTEQLMAVRALPRERREQLARAALKEIEQRYSPARGLAAYRRLLMPQRCALGSSL